MEIQRIDFRFYDAQWVFYIFWNANAKINDFFVQIQNCNTISIPALLKKMSVTFSSSSAHPNDLRYYIIWWCVLLHV